MVNHARLIGMTSDHSETLADRLEVQIAEACLLDCGFCLDEDDYAEIAGMFLNNHPWRTHAAETEWVIGVFRHYFETFTTIRPDREHFEAMALRVQAVMSTKH